MANRVFYFYPDFMEDIALHQLLDRANQLLRQVGAGILHEEQLAVALDLSVASFRETFGDKAKLLFLVIQRNLQRQRQEHDELLANLATPVECLLALLHHSLHELRRSPHYDYHVLREQYHDSWSLIQDYLYDYSLPLLTRLLQEGIQEGQFRSDLDVQMVVRIMLAQLNLVLNETYFPPDHTNQADVYRNMFAPYVRGLCTVDGLRIVSYHFERM
jgi:AcrR family transcriptional regulator